MANENQADVERLRKQATVYDAVAGRVGYEGFLGVPESAATRDTSTTSLAAVPPEEVLFRRKDAPVRFAEDDIYAADRHLKPKQKLPQSDLLKTVHAYVADFYSQSALPGHHHSLKSMDETALLAMGILLEEAASEALGETGDLAFVEPVNGDARQALPKSVVDPPRMSNRRSTTGTSRSRATTRSVSRQRSR
ncbi:hypothetical protein MBLNU230_g5953t1 [Neophaeotheca triangularis]